MIVKTISGSKSVDEMSEENEMSRRRSRHQSSRVFTIGICPCRTSGARSFISSLRLRRSSLLRKMDSFKPKQHPTIDPCRAAKCPSATVRRADPVTCTRGLFTDARSILSLFFFSFQAALCALSAALSCSTLIVD